MEKKRKRKCLYWFKLVKKALVLRMNKHICFIKTIRVNFWSMKENVFLQDLNALSKNSKFIANFICVIENIKSKMELNKANEANDEDEYDDPLTWSVVWTSG